VLDLGLRRDPLRRRAQHHGEPAAVSWRTDFGTPFASRVSQTELLDLAGAAADYWESRILDPFDFAIEIGFTRFTGALAAAFRGVPGAVGTIAVAFDRGFFVDPTPFDHSEYTQTSLKFRDFGEGLVNSQYGFGGATGPATAGFDLFTILLHEIGHTLGIGLDDPFLDGSTSIEIEAPLPFAGSIVPIFPVGSLDPGHLALGASLMSSASGLPQVDRNLPSDIDILAVAQSGGFTEVVLNGFQPIDAPGTAALLLAGSMAWLVVTRSRRPQLRRGPS
jgi:hypothetical protein